ncbi:hypothetical protein MMC26_006895 [Xylographa opegraphella]|nr:hypothetical protein [Xylographa opegraphella]
MASPPRSPKTVQSSADDQSLEGVPSSDPEISLTISHHGTPHIFRLPSTSTILDLTADIATTLAIPAASQKLLVPKLGLLKPPFAPTPLATLPSRKVQLLASTGSEIASVSAPRTASPLRSSSPLKAATPSKTHDWRKAQDEATYTFHTLLPLPYLPDPERSRRYLARLRDDAGIKAAMRKHKFSVGVLTEMNPAEHTTHESRTLGLNRNRGEVIELRLRTDAYDGYRDYKVIRKTLCHELAHNVFGVHDRNFWDLTSEIEKEVERGDWRNGGRAVSNEEFYNPDDRGEDGHVDGGGLSGGEFVLGGGGKEGSGGVDGRGGMNRRELMAEAAEERMKRQTRTGGGSRS